MSTNAKVAQDKREHPERYCYHARCLWREIHQDGRVTPCTKHALVCNDCTRRVSEGREPAHADCRWRAQRAGLWPKAGA